jgi:hypothetical protein
MPAEACSKPLAIRFSDEVNVVEMFDQRRFVRAASLTRTIFRNRTARWLQSPAMPSAL